MEDRHDGRPWPPAGSPPYTGDIPRIDIPAPDTSDAGTDLFSPPPRGTYSVEGVSYVGTGGSELSDDLEFPAPAETAAGSAGSGRSLGVMVAVPVVVLMLAGLVILVVQTTRSPDAAAADAGGGQRPPAAQAAPGQANGVPEGFRRYQDRAGFSLLVPKDWGKPQRKRTGLFFYDPKDNRRYIQVATSDRPAADALEAWRKLEEAKKRTLPEYRRVRLERIDYPGASTAADWEFTWTGVTARMHILDRTFVIGKRGVAVLISAPDKQWNRTIKKLQPVLTSYQQS